jgi:hypothetical protein
MDKYDPNKAPDPAEWLEMDESRRLMLAEDYHLRARVQLPNTTLHASFHVMAENQVALGDEMNVAKTLKRLMGDGLDRHDALHAIASVLSRHMYRLMSKESSAFSPEEYASDLEALTIEKWRELGKEED